MEVYTEPSLANYLACELLNGLDSNISDEQIVRLPLPLELVKRNDKTHVEQFLKTVQERVQALWLWGSTRPLPVICLARPNRDTYRGSQLQIRYVFDDR